MSFTGHEDHSIGLTDAAALVANFTNSQTTTDFVRAEFFGADALQSVLAQEGCVGIRIYYGLNNQNIPKLVLVGVDESENDLFNGVLAEKGLTSPPVYLSPNSLNT